MELTSGRDTTPAWGNWRELQTDVLPTLPIMLHKQLCQTGHLVALAALTQFHRLGDELLRFPNEALLQAC